MSGFGELSRCIWINEIPKCALALLVGWQSLPVMSSLVYVLAAVALRYMGSKIMLCSYMIARILYPSNQIPQYGIVDPRYLLGLNLCPGDLLLTYRRWNLNIIMPRIDPLIQVAQSAKATAFY
jgi:hypothetical protein